MRQDHIFTSATLSYLPKVRVLARSLKEHHPECKFILVLSDELDESLDLNMEHIDEVLPASQLGIAGWRSWAFAHSIVDLSTGIKPFALLKFMARPECDRVIYIDPDIALFSRFDSILEKLKTANLVLTPHQTCPGPTSLLSLETELASLNYGVYNLGFFGVNKTEVGKSFANWWAERVYRFCRVDPERGMFVDQRWVDLVPPIFDGVEIIRSSRYNLAPWNLSTRKLTGNAREGFRVDGEPLGFFHFSKVDKASYRQAIKKELYQNKSIAEIVEWYEKETESFSNDPVVKSPWAFGQFSNGELIFLAQRNKYREREDLQARFPDPFDCSQPDNYYRWWMKNTRIDWREIKKYTSRFIKIKNCRKKMVGRIWKIFCAEGFSGIIARVRVRTPAPKKIE